MDQARAERLAHQFLQAWTSQDVETVLACYAPDLVYRDPNTRGEVRGADAMRRYLTKLFAAWTMTWTLRTVHTFASGDGAAVLWHATFQRKPEPGIVEADGMDLVLLERDLVRHNEVYFDRSVLGTGAPR